MNSSLPHYDSVVVINDAEAVDLNTSWVQAHVEEVKDSYYTYSKIDDTDDDAIDAGEQPQSQPAAPPKFRDLPYAILFLVHLGIMSFLALACGKFDGLLPDMDGDSSMKSVTPKQTQDFALMVGCCIIISFLASYIISAKLVLTNPTKAVSMSLQFSIITNIAIMIILVVSFANFWAFLLGAIMIAWSIWYVFAVQIFIPFAAATLKLALGGITVNWGMYIFSLVMSALSCIWLFFWVYVANGIGFFDDVNAFFEEGRGKDVYYKNGEAYYESYYVGDGKVFTVFCMLVSLYWTSIIIINLVQTTVAGVIGTYVFDKSTASSFCSAGLMQSIVRSCTYSFGSICFGSLLNAILVALRVLLDWSRQRARESNDEGAALLYCVLQCIVSCIEDILEYFNEWAYIFVGLYGTSYLKSGQMVLELFRARGCTSIITNGLAIYVLNAIVFAVGLICGILALVVSHTNVIDMNQWAAFWTSFVAGAIIASVMMNAVQGAVKAIIVCYFDHPGRMYQNHPEETKALADAIHLLFPEVVTFAFPDNGPVV